MWVAQYLLGALQGDFSDKRQSIGAWQGAEIVVFARIVRMARYSIGKGGL